LQVLLVLELGQGQVPQAIQKTEADRATEAGRLRVYVCVCGGE